MLKVYGAQWCTFCKKLVSFLEVNNIDYEMIDIDHDIEESLVLIDKNLLTIPQVFEGDLHIGGYSETVRKYS